MTRSAMHDKGILYLRSEKTGFWSQTQPALLPSVVGYMWAQPASGEAPAAKRAPRRGLSHNGVREENTPGRELCKYRGALMGEDPWGKSEST